MNKAVHTRATLIIEVIATAPHLIGNAMVTNHSKLRHQARYTSRDALVIRQVCVAPFCNSSHEFHLDKHQENRTEALDIKS